MSHNKNIAVVYATYDGALNSTSGVGVLSRDFIKLFPSLVTSYKAKGINLALHVIAVDLAKDSHGYSDEIREHTDTVCRSTGGELHLIDNGTNKNWGYGNYENWQRSSQATALIVQELASQYDQVITYLVDTPFLGTPYYVNQILPNLDNVSLLLTPHSDLFSHYDHTYAFERLQWEAAAFQLANMHENTFVAATSQHLIDTLRTHYVLPNSIIVPLQTGLYIEDSRFVPIPYKQVEATLKAYNIPTNTNLIFSVGRAVPYKGFEDLLQSFHELRKISKVPVHLVFIASPYLYKGAASNVDTLQAMIREYKLENVCTPLFKLDMDLPRIICRWEKTKIVAQLSSREPFGLIPEELRMWSQNYGPVIVSSNVGGYKEQITDRADGFLVTPSDHAEVAKLFASILDLPAKELYQIRIAGLSRVKRDYDYAKNVSRSLNKLIK